MFVLTFKEIDQIRVISFKVFPHKIHIDSGSKAINLSKIGELNKVNKSRQFEKKIE